MFLFLYILFYCGMNTSTEIYPVKFSSLQSIIVGSRYRVVVQISRAYSLYLMAMLRPLIINSLFSLSPQSLSVTILLWFSEFLCFKYLIEGSQAVLVFHSLAFST